MAAEVWFVIAFILVTVFGIVKLANEKQAIAVKLLFILFFFLMITAGYVWMKKDVNLKSFDGIVEAGKIYFSWLGHIFKNMKNTVGYAISQDWAIEKNNSIIDEE